MYNWKPRTTPHPTHRSNCVCYHKGKHLFFGSVLTAAIASLLLWAPIAHAQDEPTPREFNPTPTPTPRPAPRKVEPRKAAPRKAAPVKAAPRRVAPKGPAPRKVSPEKAPPARLVDKVVPRKEAPKAPVGQPTSAKKAADRDSLFALRFSGYLLTGYRFTFNDPSLLRLGESDGFYVSRARLKVAAKIWQFRAVISFDGAFDRRAEPLDVSPATRRLFLEMRDAYIRYEHRSGFFAMVGQSKVPFSMHSERATTEEHFILFPLIAVGEDSAFGREVRGIIPGRDIGLTLGFQKDFGLVDLKFEAMVYNGNGANTFGNDSDAPAVAGRLSIGIGSFLKIGGSFLWNERRVGEDPRLFNESEIAFGADIALTIAGFFLEGEFAASNRSYPTTGQETAFGFGFRADAGYRIRSIGLEFAGRFELYDATDLFDDDQLMYITAAITWHYKIWKTHAIAIRLNYTLKLEQTDAQILNNDQINLLFQYKF